MNCLIIRAVCNFPENNEKNCEQQKKVIAANIMNCSY